MSFLRTNSLRVVLASFAFFGAIFAPPWVPLLLLACLAILYPAWEAALIGLLMDMVWLAPRGGDGYIDFFFSLPLYTIAALLMVWGFEPLRREFLLGGRSLL